MMFKGKPPEFAFATSACIGLAMVVAMMISATAGTVIPLFFKKRKIDPAVASGPLISTMSDLVSAVTYYSTCWLLLINVLHLHNL